MHAPEESDQSAAVAAAPASSTATVPVDETRLERLEADFAAAASALAEIERIAESPVTGEEAAVAIRALTASGTFDLVADLPAESHGGWNAPTGG